MRHVPMLLTVVSAAVGLAPGGVAVYVFGDGMRDAVTGTGAAARGAALLMAAMACLLAGVAWQFFRMARSWRAIAQASARARAGGGDHHDRTA